jgi:hypothetical protein
MPVTVSPSSFQFVYFDAALIERVASELTAALGMTDRDLRIEVDETTPLAKVEIELDPLVVRVQSGAFEDTRRPRFQSEPATATSLGRALLRARDRLVGGFGEAPADDDLTLAQSAAWEAYCVGRLERLGVPTNAQRWRYNFRNRHGFHDTADAAFDHIWASDGLTWAGLCELSRSAGASDVADDVKI